MSVVESLLLRKKEWKKEDLYGYLGISLEMSNHRKLHFHSSGAAGVLVGHPFDTVKVRTLV